MNRLIIAVLGFAMFNAASTSAKEFISHLVVQDSVMIDVNNIITSSAPLTINLVNQESKGFWNISILKDDDIFEDVSDISATDSTCTIDPNKISWIYSKRHFDPILNRDYFKLNISFCDNNGNKDSILINWALVPSRPVISDIEFRYVYDWATDKIFPNGVFSFIVRSKDATSYWFNVSNSFLYEPPSYFNWCTEYDAYDETLIFYDAEWGEYIFIEAYNTFGFAVSDMIHTTSYIHDQNILDRIEELRTASVENNHIGDPDSFIQLIDKNIIFPELAESASLYNSNGQLVNQWINIDTISTSDIPPGLYIIVCLHNTQIFKKKIIIK